MRQNILQPVLGKGDGRRADQRPAHMTRAAKDRHQEIFDAGAKVERRRAYKFLHVRIKPASPASTAARTKTVRRIWKVLIPRLSASTIPPRSARMARPCRDRRRLVARSRHSPTMHQTK